MNYFGSTETKPESTRLTASIGWYAGFKGRRLSRILTVLLLAFCGKLQLQAGVELVVKMPTPFVQIHNFSQSADLILRNGSLTRDRRNGDGNSMSLYARGGYAELGKNCTGLSEDTLTVAFWVKPGDLRDCVYFSNWHRLEMGLKDGKFYARTAFADKGRPMAGRRGKSDEFLTEQLNASVKPGIWYHLVYTFDRGNVVAYVNGTQAYRTVYNYPNAELNYYGMRFIFGRKYDNSGWSSTAHCSIDDLVIYNVALNAQQVAKLFESQGL